MFDVFIEPLINRFGFRTVISLGLLVSGLVATPVESEFRKGNYSKAVLASPSLIAAPISSMWMMLLAYEYTPLPEYIFGVMLLKISGIGILCMTFVGFAFIATHDLSGKIDT